MIGRDQTAGVGTCLDPNSTSPKMPPGIVGAYGFAFFFPFPPHTMQPTSKNRSLVRMRADMHNPTEASNDRILL